MPIESPTGIEDQHVDSKIIPLQDMADFVDKLLDNRILNSLLSYEGYNPQIRDIFPCQLFHAELIKAITYPEISYRKYCTEEYMGQGRKLRQF